VLGLFSSFYFVSYSICIEEHPTPNECEILWSEQTYQNEVQDTHRKFIVSSENMSVYITQKRADVHVSTSYGRGEGRREFK
jgi:hypothetical protein